MDPVQVGTPISASADFTDPGTGDTHTAVCDWGNGVSTPGTVCEIAGSVACGYSYPAPGSYTIQITVTDDDGGVGSESYASVFVFLPVTIDIKPGSDPNSINLGSSGTVPVAIFSTADFDATSVDPVTVTLADASVRIKGNGTPMASEDDVNGDGLLDLVVHVFTSGLQLTDGDVEAVLQGETYDGIPIQGSDMVRRYCQLNAECAYLEPRAESVTT